MTVTCKGHPGYVEVSASSKEIYLAANQAIERAYTERFGTNGVLFGSAMNENPTRTILMPHGTPNREFCNRFLDDFRGIQKQLAPDIIDFQRRVIYEFKTRAFRTDGERQLRGYYDLANLIARELQTIGWNQYQAQWRPPATMNLAMPRGMLVCTEETGDAGGLIVYTVWFKAGTAMAMAHGRI